MSVPRRALWIGITLVLLATIGLSSWRFGPEFLAVMQDEAALEAFVRWLGWLGPPVLVMLNALQIVVAPIPGYAIMAVAGFLFGPVWGGIWGTLGLLTGATLAMWIARYLGRPVVQRLIGRARLARWERVMHSNSAVIWGMLLLAPIGDVPYFIAGLSQVSFAKIWLLTLITRAPTVFLFASAGAGVVFLVWWQLALLIAVLLLLFVFFMRHQERVLGWFDAHIQRYTERGHR